MAGIANIRSGPTIYNATPVERWGVNGLTGELGGVGISTTVYLRQNAFPFACSIISPGTAEIFRNVTFTPVDDPVKGPEHIFVHLNILYPITALISALRGEASDGTNFSYWNIASNATYNGGFFQFVFDATSDPNLSLHGGAGVPLTTLTEIGFQFDAQAAGETLLESCFIEQFFIGREIQVDGGTSTTGQEINFKSISDADRSSTISNIPPYTGQFFGHVVDKGGYVELKGPVQIGNLDGVTSTYFKDQNRFIQWAEQPVNDKFYRLEIVGSTEFHLGSTTELANVTIDSPAKRWALDTATNLPTAFSTYGVVYNHGHNWKLGSTSILNKCTFNDNLDITLEGANVSESTFINCTVIFNNLPLASSWAKTTFKNCNIAIKITGGTGQLILDGITFLNNTVDIEFSHPTGNIEIILQNGATLPNYTVTGGGTVTAPAGVTRNFGFIVSPNITGFEWRLYEDDPTPGILGTLELVGEESTATNDHSIAYTYTYTIDKQVVLQIIAQGYKEFVEHYTLIDADQVFPVTLIKDINV